MTNNNYVVLLNGPPGSGKDFIGKILSDEFGGVVRRFKEELYEHTSDYYGVSFEWFVDIASDRILKEMPCELLGGISPRDALIHVSEDIYKPKYGSGYFGKKLAESLTEGITVVTDSGFMDEALEVIKEVSKENVILIRLHRKGCNFDNDSRSYIEIPSIFNIDFYNNTYDNEKLNDDILDMSIKYLFYIIYSHKRGEFKI